jgi:hypothetical protein
MAQNFKIHTHKNGDSIHLDLLGDFDGSSAYELVELLRKKSHGISKVFIHTNALKEIHPFGRNVFLSNLDSLSDGCDNLLVTGEHAEELAPEGRTIH